MKKSMVSPAITATDTQFGSVEKVADYATPGQEAHRHGKSIT
jgi:hypothetical protein